MLKDPDKSAALRGQIMRFLIAYPAYRGLSLDFESLPDDADPAYLASFRSSMQICIRATCAFM